MPKPKANTDFKTGSGGIFPPLIHKFFQDQPPPASWGNEEFQWQRAFFLAEVAINPAFLDTLYQSTSPIDFPNYYNYFVELFQADPDYFLAFVTFIRSEKKVRTYSAMAKGFLREGAVDRFKEKVSREPTDKELSVMISLAERKKIDPGGLFDFKQVWPHADAFVGISQRIRDETSDLANGLYERVQHLNVITKTSLAPVLVPVERAFEYQRFDPCQWQPKRKREDDLDELDRRVRAIEKASEFPGYVLARRKKFYQIFDIGCPHAINLYAFLLLVGSTRERQEGVSYYSRRKLTDALGLSSKQLRMATDILDGQRYLDVPLGKVRQSLRYHVVDWSTDQRPSAKGYFKLFRNLRDTCRADLLADPAMFRVWMHLLADTRSFPDEVLEIEPGEVLLKRQQMQETLTLDEKQLDTVLERLEERGSVVSKPGTPAKLIIPSWHLYQTKVYERSQPTVEGIDP